MSVLDAKQIELIGEYVNRQAHISRATVVELLDTIAARDVEIERLRKALLETANELEKVWSSHGMLNRNKWELSARAALTEPGKETK